MNSPRSYFMQDQVHDRVTAIMSVRRAAAEPLVALLPAAIAVVTGVILVQLLLAAA